MNESAFDLLGSALVEAQHVIHAYDRVADFDIVHDHTILGPLVGADRMHGRVVVHQPRPLHAGGQ